MEDWLVLGNQSSSYHLSLCHSLGTGVLCRLTRTSGCLPSRYKNNSSSSWRPCIHLPRGQGSILGAPVPTEVTQIAHCWTSHHISLNDFKLSKVSPWRWGENHSKEKSHGKTCQILWEREKGEGETGEKVNKCPQQQCSARIWTWCLGVCIQENTSSGVLWRCLKDNEWAEVQEIWVTQVFTFSQTSC